MNPTIHTDTLTVSVSDLGAELQSIRGKDGTEYLWQADPKYWPAKAPNLFPFVARLTGGKYSLDGNIYELPVHGFVQYRTFAVIEHTDTRLVLELVSDEDTLQAYLRAFAYRVEHNAFER